MCCQDLKGCSSSDRKGARRGLRSRLLRIAQLTAYEGAALDNHEQARATGITSSMCR